MTGIADLAINMIVSAQRRLETTATNVSNINTPGFRSRRIFQRVLDTRKPLPTTVAMQPAVLETGALKSTGNPLDIAVSGDGYMLVRFGDRLVPVVSAQLRRDTQGRLVDGSGGVLQASGGGDIVLSAATPALLKDGTLVINGQAEARVGVFLIADPSIDHGSFSAAGGLPDAADAAELHQGMIVSSNVDLGTEMVELTRSSRIAETGARIFQIYDDLTGRAVSKLGQLAQ